MRKQELKEKRSTNQRPRYNRVYNVFPRSYIKIYIISMLLLNIRCKGDRIPRYSRTCACVYMNRWPTLSLFLFIFLLLLQPEANIRVIVNELSYTRTGIVVHYNLVVFSIYIFRTMIVVTSFLYIDLRWVHAAARLRPVTSDGRLVVSLFDPPQAPGVRVPRGCKWQFVWWLVITEGMGFFFWL